MAEYLTIPKFIMEDVYTKPKISVYIASAYTIGDVDANVELQLQTFNTLIKRGYVPFAPLWAHFQHQKYPLTYKKWLKYGLYWLSTCDCVLRLQGESRGADIEVAQAVLLNIPVYYSLDELYNSSKNLN